MDWPGEWHSPAIFKLTKEGGSGAVCLQLVLVANNPGPTEVGALLVVAHPDNEQCLSPHLSGLTLTGDARLEFLRRLKMRERIERAG